MTREEAIKILRKLLAEDEDIDFFSYDEKKAVEYFISLSENKGEWIPVSSVEEIPKVPIWVTHKGADYAYVEVFGWDSQRNCRTEDGGFRCDSDGLKDVVAYMPYSEPEPYKEGGNDER